MDERDGFVHDQRPDKDAKKYKENAHSLRSLGPAALCMAPSTVRSIRQYGIDNIVTISVTCLRHHLHRTVIFSLINSIAVGTKTGKARLVPNTK